MKDDDLNLPSAPNPGQIDIIVGDQAYTSFAADTTRFEKAVLTDVTSGDTVEVGMLILHSHQTGQLTHQSFGKQDLLILAAKATEMANSIVDQTITH